jgi:predicted nucleic acid-binding Zn ribbon protein
MADDVDRVNELLELEELSVLHRQRKERVHLHPVGMCYECSEPLSSERTFCDADCRDMYDKRQEARLRNGR